MINLIGKTVKIIDYKLWNETYGLDSIVIEDINTKKRYIILSGHKVNNDLWTDTEINNGVNVVEE